jgi:16S rRNA (uracil1498-N3)-methyltransferase
MISPRFFCAAPLAPGMRRELPETVARHAVRVLRLMPGAALTLFDGEGGEYAATIAGIVRERVTVDIGAWRAVEREAPLSITLAQALQAADKMDFTLQKAVELGVTVFQPLASRRSVVRLSGDREEKRLAHWRGVALAAAEQCGRNRLTTVAPLLPLERWLADVGRPADGLKLMFLPDAEQALAAAWPAGAPPLAVQVLIGAEGGLDPGEIAAARAAGFLAVRLGPRILRTETAGLAALAAIQTLWGDFKGA